MSNGLGCEVLVRRGKPRGVDCGVIYIIFRWLEEVGFPEEC
jgi:hypothetical protein